MISKSDFIEVRKYLKKNLISFRKKPAIMISKGFGHRLETLWMWRHAERQTIGHCTETESRGSGRSRVKWTVFSRKLDGPTGKKRSSRKWAVSRIEWFVEKVDGPKGESGRSKEWKRVIKEFKTDRPKKNSGWLRGESERSQEWNWLIQRM